MRQLQNSHFSLEVKISLDNIFPTLNPKRHIREKFGGGFKANKSIPASKKTLGVLTLLCEFLVGAFLKKRARLLQSLVFFFKTDSKRRTSTFN